jgi:hypothetical protein
MDLNIFASEGQLFFSIYLSSLTNVVSVNARLMTDTSNYVDMSVLVADLATGWNHLKVACNKGVQAGVGVNWKAVKKVAIGIVFGAAGNTLSGILVDAVRIQIPTASVEFDAYVDNVSVSVGGDTIANALYTRLTDGVDELDILSATSTTASKVIPTKLYDNSGNAITSFGGGLTNVVGSVVVSGTQSANTSTSTATNVVPIKLVNNFGVADTSNVVRNDRTPPEVYSSPSDITAVFSTTESAVVTGLSFTPVSNQIDGVWCRSASTGIVKAYSPTQYGCSYTDLTTSGVVTVVGASFGPTDTITVQFSGQKKAFVSASNSIRVNEISPLYNQSQDISLADTTDVAAGDNYYPAATGGSMTGYRDLSLTGSITNPNATDYVVTQACNDADTTTGDWITIYGLNSAGVLASGITCASTTTPFSLLYKDLGCFSNYRVKYTAGDATNTVIIKAKLKA